jgi:hypothetical protein
VQNVAAKKKRRTTAPKVARVRRDNITESVNAANKADHEEVLRKALSVAETLVFTVKQARAGNIPLKRAAAALRPFVKQLGEGEIHRLWKTESDRAQLEDLRSRLVAWMTTALAELKNARTLKQDADAEVLLAPILDASTEDAFADLNVEQAIRERLSWKAPTQWRNELASELLRFDENIANDVRCDPVAAAERVLAKQMKITKDALKNRLKGR